MISEKRADETILYVREPVERSDGHRLGSEAFLSSSSSNFLNLYLRNQHAYCICIPTRYVLVIA